MKVLLIDTDSTAPQIVDTAGGLKEWYRLLKCDLIDITERAVAGRYYDIIVDDEGLLKGGGEGYSAGGKPTPLKLRQRKIKGCSTPAKRTTATGQHKPYYRT